MAVLMASYMMSKRCARWVPHMLSDDQRSERVRVCHQWLKMFVKDGPKRLSDVVREDECWMPSSLWRISHPT